MRSYFLFVFGLYFVTGSSAGASRYDRFGAWLQPQRRRPETVEDSSESKSIEISVLQYPSQVLQTYQHYFQNHLMPGLSEIYVPNYGNHMTGAGGGVRKYWQVFAANNPAQLGNLGWLQHLMSPQWVREDNRWNQHISLNSERDQRPYRPWHHTPDPASFNRPPWYIEQLHESTQQSTAISGDSASFTTSSQPDNTITQTTTTLRPIQATDSDGGEEFDIDIRSGFG